MSSTPNVPNKSSLVRQKFSESRLHDPLEDVGRKVVHEHVLGHGHVFLEGDLVVVILVTYCHEAVHEVLELLGAEVEGMHVWGNLGGLQELESGEVVVVVGVHEHEGDLLGVPWMFFMEPRKMAY